MYYIIIILHMSRKNSRRNAEQFEFDELSGELKPMSPVSSPESRPVLTSNAIRRDQGSLFAALQRQPSPVRSKFTQLRSRTSPKKNTPKRIELKLDNERYKSIPQISIIREKLMSLAELADKTKKRTQKVKSMSESIKLTLHNLDPYFEFIQKYISSQRSRIESQIQELMDQSQNPRIDQGEHDRLQREIAALKERLASTELSYKVYQDVLNDIPNDIDKIREIIDAEDSELDLKIDKLNEMLQEFGEQIRTRLRNALPADKHGDFDRIRSSRSRGGGAKKRSKNKRSKNKRSKKRYLTKRR